MKTFCAEVNTPSKFGMFFVGCGVLTEAVAISYKLAPSAAVFKWLALTLLSTPVLFPPAALTNLLVIGAALLVLGVLTITTSEAIKTCKESNPESNPSHFSLNMKGNING